MKFSNLYSPQAVPILPLMTVAPWTMERAYLKRAASGFFKTFFHPIKLVMVAKIATNFALEDHSFVKNLMKFFEQSGSFGCKTAQSSLVWAGWAGAKSKMGLMEGWELLGNPFGVKADNRGEVKDGNAEVVEVGVDNLAIVSTTSLPAGQGSCFGRWDGFGGM